MICRHMAPQLCKTEGSFLIVMKGAIHRAFPIRLLYTRIMYQFERIHDFDVANYVKRIHDSVVARIGMIFKCFYSYKRSISL